MREDIRQGSRCWQHPGARINESGNNHTRLSLLPFLPLNSLLAREKMDEVHSESCEDLGKTKETRSSFFADFASCVILHSYEDKMQNREKERERDDPPDWGVLRESYSQSYPLKTCLVGMD